jgi:hypothetical protein
LVLKESEANIQLKHFILLRHHGWNDELLDADIQPIQNKSMSVFLPIAVRDSNRVYVYGVGCAADLNEEVIEVPWGDSCEEVAGVGLGVSIGVIMGGMTILEVDLQDILCQLDIDCVMVL